MANEDYTSRVPHYTFPDTLEEQEAALETNPTDAAAQRGSEGV